MILWQRLQSAVRQQRYIRMIHVHVAVERNTNSVVEDAKENQVKIQGVHRKTRHSLFRFYKNSGRDWNEDRTISHMQKL